MLNETMKRDLYDPLLPELELEQNETIAQSNIRSTIGYCQELADDINYDDNSGFDFLLNEYWLTQYSYIREGQILWHLFNGCQWKKDKSIKNYKQFCKQVLEKPYWRIRNTINSSHLASLLIGLGFVELPKNESICSILYLLKGDHLEFENSDYLTTFEERLKFIWGKVILEDDKTKITAKRVKEVIKFYLPEFVPIPKNRKISINLETADRLEGLAISHECSVENFVENLIDNFEDKNNDDNIITDNDDTENLSDFDNDEILKEISLLQRLKKLCDQLAVNPLDVLDRLISEDNIIKLLSVDAVLPMVEKLKPLNVDQLANRLTTTVKILLSKYQLENWIVARDPEGINWIKDIDNLFYPQLKINF